jgi:transposase InsO family protein
MIWSGKGYYKDSLKAKRYPESLFFFVLSLAETRKRLYRIYTELKLNIRPRCRKRLPARPKQSLFQPQNINEVWSIDFMSDSLWDGRTSRLLNLVDDYNREVLHIDAILHVKNQLSKDLFLEFMNSKNS